MENFNSIVVLRIYSGSTIFVTKQCKNKLSDSNERHYEDNGKNIESRINFKCGPLKMAAYTGTKCHR